MKGKNLVALIPARGGSKRLRQKNLLPVDGVPLVIRAIRLAEQFTDQIIVDTDSPEIAAIAQTVEGVQIYKRKPPLASDTATVDQVVLHHIRRTSETVSETDYLVIQPTVVFDRIPVSDIDYMIEDSVVPTTLAVDTHNIWSNGKQIGKRRGRYPSDVLQEIGIRYYPAGSTTTGRPEATLWTDVQAIDIDYPQDLVAANALASRKHIVFRFLYSTELGAGHVRRCVALADQLQHHRISLHNLGGQPVPEELTGGWPIDDTHIQDYDLIVNDMLDTSVAEMAELRRWAPVIAVEDQGYGAHLATHVVNALYGDTQFSGSQWAVLRPEFALAENRPLKDREIDILVTFGGTDPNRLTERLYDTLKNSGVEDLNVVYVQPPGSPNHLDEAIEPTNMASLLTSAKLVFTSGGRTVYEAAACGTPTAVICQNIRETTHAHLGHEYGNHYLGLQGFVDRAQIHSLIRSAFRPTYPEQSPLEAMSVRAYNGVDRKGLGRFVDLIERTLRDGQ